MEYTYTSRYMKRSCFVAGCSSGYCSTKVKNKITNTRNPSLFTVTKDPQQLQKWRDAVPKRDRMLTSSDVICELHFKKEDIEWAFETKMPDGTVFSIKRERPRLKTDVIPSIFRQSVFQETTPARTSNSVDQTYSSDSLFSTETPSKGIQVYRRRVLTDITSRTNNIQDEIVTEKAAVSEEDGSFEVHLFSMLKNMELTLPSSFWSQYCVQGLDAIIYCKWNTDYIVTKKVILESNLEVKVLFGCVKINNERLKKHITSSGELEELLKTVDDFVSCAAIEVKTLSDSCNGIGDKRTPQRRGNISSKCLNCRKIRMQRTQEKPVVLKKRYSMLKSKHQLLTKKHKRLCIKVDKLESNLQRLRDNFSRVKEESLVEIMEDLSPLQQEAIRACFAASTKKSNAYRYTTVWVYECLLLRIRGKGTYEHLRRKKILPLPCRNTLGKYMKKVKACFGFQQNIFDLMQKKGESMTAQEKRGVLLFDEMKVTESLSFDSSNLVINGFTDLGDHTPENQKQERGDHALVFMFQPFRGSWVQTVGAFLSKGCAVGSVLHKLIIECIVLLERAGFCVDLLTGDGATWNRSMWSLFEISEQAVSCAHIYDESRRLWFCSDFPHLIKNLWTFLTKSAETWTPEGIVKLKHWWAIIEADNPEGYNLKLVPGLTEADIKPKHYQKMNVGRAYRFFGAKTAAAMQTYKSDGLHPNLVDSGATVEFIKKINKLIIIMGNRAPGDGSLRTNSEETRFLEDFCKYLREWREIAKKFNYKYLSDSTHKGFLVTLQTTVELITFLTKECGFAYLMTARLNQDLLEANIIYNKK